MERLLSQIHKEIVCSRRRARRNYWAAYSVYVAALLATVGATFVTASEYFEPLERAFVTALPGLIVLVSSTLQFQQKSHWYWMRVRRFEALANKALFEGAKLEDISREFGELKIRMEDDWPGFEPLPTEHFKSLSPAKTTSSSS